MSMTVDEMRREGACEECDRLPCNPRYRRGIPNVEFCPWVEEFLDREDEVEASDPNPNRFIVSRGKVIKGTPKQLSMLAAQGIVPWDASDN